MFINWIIYIILTTVTSSVTQNDSDAKILNGRDAKAKEFPFIARIQRILSGSQLCGATLITNRYLITAGHCVTTRDKKAHKDVPDNPDKYIVTAGTRHTTQKEFGYRRRSIKWWKAHPHFNREEDTFIPQFDVGFVSLIEGFNINEYIMPLPMFSRDVYKMYSEYYNIINRKTVCQLMGWGMTNYYWDSKQKEFIGTSLSQNLKVVDVYVIYESLCQSKICAHDRIFCPSNIKKSRGLCAQGVKKKTGMCHGDSGSPLVCNGRFWGVASWSLECGAFSVPQMYAHPVAILDLLDLYKVNQTKSTGHTFQLKSIVNFLPHTVVLYIIM